MKFARVLVDQSGSTALDYEIPAALDGRVQVGSRVGVSVRYRQAMATVIEILDSTEVPGVKPLNKVIGDRPVLSANLLRLAHWMAHYYCCSVETAMRAVLPQVIRKGNVGFKEQLCARLVHDVSDEVLAQLEKRAPKQAALVTTLREATGKSAKNPTDEAKQGTEGPASGHPLMMVTKLLKLAGADRAALAALVRKGVIATEHQKIDRKPDDGETFVLAAPLALNEEQVNVFTELCKTLDAPSKPILLQGVTGSGKTEIYLQGIQKVLDRGQSAIMLVPEIALTPQTVERFKSRFAAMQQEVAVLHSHLSEGERHDEWHKINNGKARIVIGARSAVFAPLENLGLIVVDEEHENSYKQEDAPRYHARDLAVLRGHFEKCAVLLGSATPSLESFHNARTGKYQLLRMMQRVDDRKLPYFRIIDMRLESTREKATSIISEKMRQAIEARLARREQSILFLNRRGFSTALACDACGYVAQCPNCSVALTFHRNDNRIVCHVCGHMAVAPDRCPECKNAGIKYTGVGTEKVEEAVKQIFPKATVKRMDADTMTRKEAYRETLTAFRTGKIDILLGTQMIAKGLHFPNVTLVGIINADMGLHMPDFRAGERTFQLLTQVAGRAGRGDVEGEVFVQSFTPHHPAIQFARHHDFDGFAEQEIDWRRQWDYPPFSKMVLITARSPHQERGSFSLETLARRLKDLLPPETILSEPTPAPLEKSHGNYRFHLMLRTHSIPKLTRALQEVLAKLTFPEDVVVSVDIDPYQLL
jgi:primosomal protein N' (replication factor Y)